LRAADATGVESAAPKSSAMPWIILSVFTTLIAGVLIALQVVPGKQAPISNRAPDAGAINATIPTETSVLAPVPELSAPAHVVPIEPHAPAAPLTAGPPVPTAEPSVPLEDIVSRSIPAIVSIETGQGRGSGFFAAPRTVITNRHVIQNNVSVTVRLSSGQTLPGRVETSSQEFDLAVVRVDSASPDQPLLPLGTVDEVRPGQEVIAIGLALGVFQNSVTRGIISAVRRADRTVLLQTDAAINPGNSGGPLLNRQGHVVGINTLKVTGAAESLGFAVAVDHARGILSGGKQPQTPLIASAPASRALAPAFSSGSSIDSVRADGTRRYEQVVEVVARRAGQIDSYWNRIRANCKLRVTSGYDREWFGLWDGRTTVSSPDISCSTAVTDLEGLASEVRAAMSAAQEEARRASVLPGQLRDIRRRYRMDWAGFDR
jgi:S1-C subfamily serine protease